jgi:hypothetical protein
MTEVTGRLRWDGRNLYLGVFLCGSVWCDAGRGYWEAETHGMSTCPHPSEQAARDALFARVKAAITEGTP